MTTKNVLALALEALLDCARKAEALKKECGMNPESPQAIRNSQYMAISYTAHAAITAIKQAQEPVAKVSWNLKYADSTPKLHVGNSAFEDWFQAQPFATQIGVKQMCRDSYAAGMGDPLVTYATHPAPKQAEPIQPSSQKTLALAQEGMDLHDHNAPEYIICAELMRLNKALAAAPTPPEAK